MVCLSPPRRRQISAATAALTPSDAAPAPAARKGVLRMGSAPSKEGTVRGAKPVILLMYSKAARELMQLSSSPV